VYSNLYLYCRILCVIIICGIPEDEPVIGSKHVGLYLNILIYVKCACGWLLTLHNTVLCEHFICI
jgi:hypothetical protein